VSDLGDVSLEGTASDVTVGEGDDTGRLVRSSGIVALGTLLSRLTGLVRVGALTYAIGAVALADTYNLANTTPNIVYELLLGGVLSATLVPVFVDRFEDGDDDAVSVVLTVATVVLVALTVVGVVLAPLLFALYDRPELEDVGVPLLRLFLPQMLFYGWTALGTAVLNAKRRFAVPAFAPILNNVIVSGALLAFAARVSDPTVDAVTDDAAALWLLGLGTTAGIVAMTVPLWPAMRRAGVHPRWQFEPRHPAVATVVRRSGWTLGYVAANQIGLTVMLAVAASTATGLVSAYTYAFIFFQLPHGLVAVSLMTTFVPTLASAWNRDDLDAYRERFGLGLRLLLTGVVPAVVGYLILGGPLVSVLLERGSFDDAAAASTTEVLRYMTLGLPGFSAYLFALRGFFAQGDTRTPFLLNVAQNAVQVALVVLLVPNLDNPGQGLGIAYAAAYTIAAVAALVVLDRRVGGVLEGRLASLAARLAVAGVAAALAAAGAVALLSVDDDAAWQELVVGLPVAAVAFVAAAAALRITEVRDLIAAVADRRGRG
jgi:putative peptidoglycan lipid II flippase